MPNGRRATTPSYGRCGSVTLFAQARANARPGYVFTERTRAAALGYRPSTRELRIAVLFGTLDPASTGLNANAVAVARSTCACIEIAFT
jgi:hypothetical protein